MSKDVSMINSEKNEQESAKKEADYLKDMIENLYKEKLDMIDCRKCCDKLEKTGGDTGNVWNEYVEAQGEVRELKKYIIDKINEF